MQSKILILKFPKEASPEPVVCYLARDYELTFAILHANIFPRREGMMVLELKGTRENFKKGLEYLKSKGIKVSRSDQEVTRDEERCTHCGACTAVCPTGALSIKRPSMEVIFDLEKCSACELCVPTCPSHAMKANPKDKNFF